MLNFTSLLMRRLRADGQCQKMRIIKIQTFLFCLPKYPLHSHGLIVAPKVLADVVESTIGAVFIDNNSSLDTTWETLGTRNGVHRLDMDLHEWPNQKTTQRHEAPQTHEFVLFDGSDYQEFRLMDAKGEAQQARKVAKLKRERAQRLLYWADLAVHKSAVALMTAETIKASFDGSGADT